MERMTQIAREQAQGRVKHLWELITQAYFPLLILIAILSVTSLYSVNTASSSETYKVYFSDGSMLPIIKHAILLIGSLVAMLAVACIPSRFFRILGTFAYLIFCIGLLIGLWLWGITINDATRWFVLPGISFFTIQPSEFVKLCFIMLLALFTSAHQRRHGMGWGDLCFFYLFPLSILCVFTYFLGKENISTMAIYVGFTLLYLFIIRMPFRWWSRMAIGVAAAGALFVATLMIAPAGILPGRLGTAKARLERKFTAQKGEDEFILKDEHRQEQYGKIALANSRLFMGEGVGDSKMKDILPMANSDYIYAILIEENGLIALLGVPILYIAWFCIAGILARRETNLFNKYVLYGIGLFYPLQALVNIIVVSGVITTGQPLPFLSAGGSSLLACCIAFGVMISISRNQYLRKCAHPADDPTRLSEVSHE